MQQDVQTGSPFPPGLVLVTSNLLERLVEELARTLRVPLSSPFSPETIVIQSRGMERWISMEIARINGVFGNGWFPFPNTFFNEISKIIIHEASRDDDTAFDPDVMSWRIMQHLATSLQLPGFAPLKRYLAEDRTGVKRYQLSRRISDLFDQYLVFRPDFILQWEEGRGTHWQAQLWRLLSKEGGSMHRARMRTRVLEKIHRQEGKPPGIPDRLSVFGISYLPPFFLEIFTALARWIPVQVFFISPCREYWADLATRREARRIIRRYEDKDPEGDLHLEKGNPLLAAMGKLGRDFLLLISECESRGHELFERPAADTLLHRLQGDLLDMKYPEGGRIHGIDRSIQIHAAHSPMREVEILHDQLLSMFEEVPGLKPRDILVMTPQIDVYAPFIHAVFGNQRAEETRIPYRIADQSLRSEGRIVEQFLSFFRLVGSRLGVTDVLEILRYPLVRDRFHLSETEIDSVEHWLRDAGVRWGKDAADRARLGLPADAANTWEAGLQRLLLGYAMPEEDRLVLGALPYGDIEGSEARVLGRFLEFIHKLFDLLEKMEAPRSLAKWRDLLEHLFADFFQAPESPEMDALREAVDVLSRQGIQAGFSHDVGHELVRAWFAHRLENRFHGSGFLTGDVTFCAMLPMRSIPFRVICMIGMNGTRFPRESHPLDFDLMAAAPRVGDRSRRDDDKYLFLEALISARDRLYISYVGQNVQDNSLVPPSVLVSELTDFLRDGYGVSESHFLTRHRLQAFSPAYFQKGSRLFSYSEENLQAAAVLHAPKSSLPFFSTPLSMNESEGQGWRTLDLADLREFFIQPVRFLLRRRLDLVLEKDPEAPANREPFSLDGLQKYAIGRDLTLRALASDDPPPSLAVERCRGRLPLGAPGQALYSQLEVDADAFVRKIQILDRGAPMEPMEIRIDLKGYVVSGVIDGLHRTGRYGLRYGRSRAKDLISAWIDHLALHAAGGKMDSFFYFQNEAWRFSSVPDPKEPMAAFLDLYWQGLHTPLPFFPETSLEYARAVLVNRADSRSALSKARRKWENEFTLAESKDPYHRLCFGRETDPLDPLFCETAVSVWGPFFQGATQLPW